MGYGGTGEQGDVTASDSPSSVPLTLEPTPLQMDMKFEDLVVTCEKCGGAGEIKESGGSTGGFGMSWSKQYPCTACAGRGTNLTPQGEELLKFFRHLKIKHHL